MSKTPTPHIGAQFGDIAETVIMAGDPLRVKLMAEKYLDDAVQFNHVRGMLGYTGTYKGKRVSVMGHGMGIPSIGIYTYELYNFYGVKTIIRVGSAGSINRDLHIGDLAIAMGACTNSHYADQYELPGTFAPIADFDLIRKAVEACEQMGYHYKVGNVLSSDVFYNENAHNDKWINMGVLAVEMEISALYMNAARSGNRALGICTISDHILTGEVTTAEERQNNFTHMMDVLLVSCLSLVRTHLREEGLDELEQLANGNDGTSHRLYGVVDDVEAILYRLLVKHVGEGHVTLFVGELQSGNSPPVNTDLRGSEVHGNLLGHALAAHHTLHEPVQLLGKSLNRCLVGIVATGMGHLILQLHHLSAVVDSQCGSQVIIQREGGFNITA